MSPRCPIFSGFTVYIYCYCNVPGAMVQTRIPYLAKSLATGRVIPTMPPLLAEYAACPICPSNAATLAVLTMTPVEERQGEEITLCCRGKKNWGK